MSGQVGNNLFVDIGCKSDGFGGSTIDQGLDKIPLCWRTDRISVYTDAQDSLSAVQIFMWQQLKASCVSCTQGLPGPYFLLREMQKVDELILTEVVTLCSIISTPLSLHTCLRLPCACPGTSACSPCPAQTLLHILHPKSTALHVQSSINTEHPEHHFQQGD